MGSLLADRIPSGDWLLIDRLLGLRRMQGVLLTPVQEPKQLVKFLNCSRIGHVSVFERGAGLVASPLRKTPVFSDTFAVAGGYYPCATTGCCSLLVRV